MKKLILGFLISISSLTVFNNIGYQSSIVECSPLFLEIEELMSPYFPKKFMQLLYQREHYCDYSQEYMFKIFELADKARFMSDYTTNLKVTITAAGSDKSVTLHVLDRISPESFGSAKMYATLALNDGPPTHYFILPGETISKMVDLFEPFHAKDILATAAEISYKHDYHLGLNTGDKLETWFGKRKTTIEVIGDESWLVLKTIPKNSLRAWMYAINSDNSEGPHILVWSNLIKDILQLHGKHVDMWRFYSGATMLEFMKDFTYIMANYYVFHTYFFSWFDPSFSFPLPGERAAVNVFFIWPTDTIYYSSGFSYDMFRWWIWGFPNRGELEGRLTEWISDTAWWIDQEYDLNYGYDGLRWLYYEREDLGPWYPLARPRRIGANQW